MNKTGELIIYTRKDSPQDKLLDTLFRGNNQTLDIIGIRFCVSGWCREDDPNIRRWTLKQILSSIINELTYEAPIPYTKQVFPTPMRLPCPSCGKLHIDEGEFEHRRHHTHACQFCGMVWRPALVDTVGVQFLPGFKNES